MGIVVSCLVVFVLYDMLTSQQRVYGIQDDVSEMQQNLRIGMGRISQDLTMAGFGKPSHLGRTAWPQLNEETSGGITYSIQVDADEKVLDIVGCLEPPQGHAQAALTAGSTTITLATGEGANFNTTTKRDISIGGAENARIASISGDSLTIDTNPALTGNQGLLYGHPSNERIYLVMHVTYSIDSTNPSQPVLVVDKHQGRGSEPVAQYIKTMTVALSGNALDITLTGRTRNPDRTTGQYTEIQTQSEVYLRNLPNIST